MGIFIPNKKESIIRDYFPNRRLPSSISVQLSWNIVVNFQAYDYSDKIEDYCKLVWDIEARFGNRSNFIFKGN